MKTDWVSSYRIILWMKKTLYSSEQKHFITLLRQMRQNSQLNQKELSEKLEIPQSTVSNVERGESQIDLMELRQWLKAVNTDLLDFVRRFEETVQSDEDNNTDRHVY